MLNSEIYINFLPLVGVFLFICSRGYECDCTGGILTHGKEIFFPWNSVAGSKDEMTLPLLLLQEYCIYYNVFPTMPEKEIG